MAFSLTTFLISIAISVALNLAVSLLFPRNTQRPQQQQPQAPNGSFNEKQPIPPLRDGFGRFKTGGDIAFLEEAGGTAYQIIVHMANRIEGYVSHWLHDEEVTLSGGDSGNVTVPAHFASKVFIAPTLGLDAETAWAAAVTAFPSIWTADHRGDGLSKVFLIFNGSEQERFANIYPQGFPVHTAVIDSARVYDPRDDGQDPDDPSTWLYSRNIALGRLYHLTRPSGGRLTLADMYLPDWAAAADVSDEEVLNRDGDPEKRYWGGLSWKYRGDGQDAVSVGRTIDEAGELVVYQRGDGLIGVHAGAMVTPDIRLETSILALRFDANQSRQQTVLAVRGHYIAPDVKWTPVDAAIWGDPYEGADQTQRTKTVDNLAVQSHNHMQRLQKLAFIRANAPRVSVTVQFDAAIADLMFRRFVKVHYPPKLDEAIVELVGGTRLDLTNLTISFDGIVVPATLYDFDAEEEEGEPPTTPDILARNDVPVPEDFAVELAYESLAAAATFGYVRATWTHDDDNFTHELQYQPDDESQPARSVLANAGEDEVRTPVLEAGIVYRLRLRALSAGAPSEWTAYLTQAIAADFPHQAATFDGTNDYMARGADLTGLADGKAGTISCWVRLNGGDGSSQVITGTNNTVGNHRFHLSRTSANIFLLRARNAAGTAILIAQTTGTYVAGAAWRHVLASWDLAAGHAHLYVNDLADLDGSPTVTNDTIDYTTGDWFVGADNAAAFKLNATLADLWFAPAYIDLSVTANRRKFITASGAPVYLGADGSRPTGTAPPLFLAVSPEAADASGFATNRGAGGNFTITGSLGLVPGPLV